MKQKPDVIAYIPFGKENAITRTELAILLHESDRVVRHLISSARRYDCILNIQDGDGYYRPTESDKSIVERWMKQEQSRAKSIFRSTRGAKEFLKDAEGN